MRHTYRRYLFPALLMAIAAAAMAWGPDALAAFGLEEAAGSKIPKTKDLSGIIANILRAALGFVGTLFLLLMLYAGFQWMTARGDSKKVDDAKKLITGAVIGIVLIASAYAITDFVLKAATGTAEVPKAEETTGNSSCQPFKCVNNSDCSDTSCYTGTCRCLDNGAPPCNRAGGQDGQCVMK